MIKYFRKIIICIFNFLILISFKWLKQKFFLISEDFLKTNYEKIPNFEHSEEIGLIVQGPFIKNLTINNLIYYRKYYPDICIIYSTTDQINMNTKKLLKNNKVIYMKCDYVSNSFANLINQSNTCIKAANHLEKKQIKFALKIRSDQRLSNPYFIKNIFNHYNYFSYNKNKILFTSHGSHKYWPYDVNDFIIYAPTRTFTKFFQINEINKIQLLDKKFIRDKKTLIQNAKNNFEWSSILGGGSYFAKSYLKNKYRNEPKHDLETYYSYLKKDFIVIDNYYLGIQWYKYNNFLHRDSKNLFFPKEKDSEITFLFWLSLFKNKKIDYSSEYLYK